MTESTSPSLANKEKAEAMAKKMQAQFDECGGDYIEWAKKYNQHTVKVSLVNEQVGKELWGNTSYTFINEDNAISHYSIVSELLDLLAKEENKGWGFKHTPAETVNNILNPIKDRLMGVMDTYQDEEED